jgi:glutamine amidotransferase
MCQLLGMNCNVPTDICFSFAGFQARGGGTDIHRDGWGIGFFEGRGCRTFLDPLPSAESPVAQLVRDYPIRSLNVIAHIRKATHGVISLENTHPFQRVQWGRYWLFAHNGFLPEDSPPLAESVLPVGNTDSERSFCYLLERLREKFGHTDPGVDAVFPVVAEICREIGATGEFNFLLSNGDWLLAHCSTNLCYIVRKAPFAVAHLKDEDVAVDFNEVTTPNDRVAVITTTPLTDNEVWTTMPAGSLWLFRDGEPLRRTTTIKSPPRMRAPQSAEDLLPAA